VTITFAPNVSAEYKTTAFLDVVGRDDRLPLWISGTGVGPKACLSYDSLDLGDLFINSRHQYEFTIENRGDIPCTWELENPTTPFADIFEFSTRSGTLSVDSSSTICVQLFSTDKLGDFDEVYEFKLHGSDEKLKFHFKGCIIGPTFHFDVDTIDFGLVSYEFLHSKNLMLYNTSEIPMTYSLSVPQDGAFVQKEFEITPSSGTLQPNDQQSVRIDLISTTLKEYEYSLAVDVDGVGKNLLSLPILADCQVPRISVQSREVPYGDCFIRFPYTQELTLVNTDPVLSAKYEVISQDPSTLSIASYEAIPPVGSVPPNTTTKVAIKVIGEKLGNFRLPVMLSIAGSVEPPLQSSVVANCVGPKITLSHEAIKWGPTTCLIDNVRDLILTNESEIPAPFKVFLKNARSKFRVDVRDGVLSPHESVVLHVIACLDDTILHKDQLHIIVAEGENLMVPLSAKGIGTTLYSHEDLKVIDFGPTFTNQECAKYITIENKGRRPQSLRWINQTIKDRMLSNAAKMRKIEQDAKKSGKKQKLESIEPIFTVNPPEIELPPRTHIRFHLTGHCKQKGIISERLILETKVLKDKQSRVVFDTTVTADFLHPLLDLTSSELSYNYTWEQGVPIDLITKPLTLTNKTPLPLDFVLKAQIPFSLDVWEHSLAPQESTTINVDFDPGYKIDRKSHTAESKLVAVYRDHPQRDNINLLGEINFPNLDFEYTVINFGCVLNDTTKTMLVKVTNVSKVDTAFQWSFVEDETAAKASATTRKPYIPVNQVFDILPIRSLLKPGESEDVEFVYYGHNNRRFKGMCVCEVEGGPEYEITLLGEASQVGYKLDRSLLDFGKVLHTKSEEREFYIVNTGKVAFNYSISQHLVSRKSLLHISQPQGKVFPHEKQKIMVRFSPGLPEKFFEKLVLEIAHFDPVELPVYGEGIYCQLAVSLPRDEKVNPWGLPLSSPLPSWPEILEDARCNLIDPSPLLSPPNPSTLPPPPNATSTISTNLIAPPTASTMANSSRPQTGMSTGLSAGLSSPGSTSSLGLGESRPTTRGTTLGDESRPNTSNMPPNNGGGTINGSNPFPILDAYPLEGMEERAKRREPSPMEIEMEANRLVFLRHIQEKERRAEVETGKGEKSGEVNNPSGRDQGAINPESDKVNPESDKGTTDDIDGSGENRNEDAVVVPPAVISPIDEEKKEETTPRQTPPKKALGRTTKTKSSGGGKIKNADKEDDGFIIARHCCDFGHIVVGQTRKRTFRITNTSPLGQLSWVFDKNLLAGTGFSLEPEKVVRLPEKQHVSFNVTFTAKKNAVLGEREVVVPLLVKNGPAMTIILRSNVTVPEIKMSGETMEFGDVWIGECKRMYLQLDNVSPVPAEWDFKKPIGSTRDEGRFEVHPRGGTLMPGEKCNVSVTFSPGDERPHQLKVPLKISSGSRAKEILLLGGGKQVHVTLNPSFAELGPMLPGTEGGVERVVEMTNESGKAIEVYSVDFDKRFLEEEEVLAKAGGYGEDGVMQLPVRGIGEGLPEHIVKEWEERMEVEKKSQEKRARRAKRTQREERERLRQEAIDNGEDPPAAGEEDDILEDTSSSDDDSVDAEGVEAAGGSALLPSTPRWSLPPSARSVGSSTDFVVCGPPLSGKSSLCKALGKHLSYPVITLDGIVEEITQRDSELGGKVRVSLGQRTKKEERAVAKRLKTLEEIISKEKEDREAEKAAKAKGKKGKKGEEEVVEEAGLSPSEKERDELINASGPGKDLLKEILEWKIGSEECGFGCIVDDLQSSFVSRGEAAEVIRQALPNSILVELKADEVTYEKRMRELVEMATEDYDELKEEFVTSFEGEDRGEGKEEGGGFDRQNGDQDQPGPLNSSPRSRATGAKGERPPAVPPTPMTMMTEIPVTEEDVENFVEMDEMELFTLSETNKRHYWACRDASRKKRFEKAIDVKERVERVWRGDVGGLVGKDSGEEQNGDNEGGNDGAPLGQTIVTDVDVGKGDGGKNSDKDTDRTFENFFSYNAGMASCRELFSPPLPVRTDGRESVGEEGKTEAAETNEGADERADELRDDMVNSLLDEGANAATTKAPTTFISFPIPLSTAIADVSDQFIAALPSPIVPPPAPGALLIPNPTTRIIVKRPYPRMEITPVYTEEKGFQILPPPAEDGNKEKDDDCGNAESHAEISEADAINISTPPTRWIIPAHSSIKFTLKFHSSSIGRFDASLGFEVVGGGARPFALPCAGRCEVPTINSDPRNVFMNRVKHRAIDAPPLSKKFIVSRDVYEFGPLLTWKTPTLMEQVEPPVENESKDSSDPVQVLDVNSPYNLAATALATNCESFRVSNNGNFPTTVSFAFAEAKKAAEGGGADPNPNENVFFVDPDHVRLSEGDTADVKVWSFPTEDKTLYEDKLIATLEDSPFATEFSVSALGAKPTLTMRGKWSDEADLLDAEADAIEILEAPGADSEKGGEDGNTPMYDEATNEANKTKKAELQTKALALRSDAVADFDRLLLGRTEENDFVLKNDGVVPLLWKIDASDLDDIDEFRISPTEGVLQPEETQRVVIGFEAIVEKELAPSITVHYSDTEGGFESENPDRCYSFPLAIKAEAYSIKAVAFEEDDDSNDGVIDYGNMRVGDTAVNKFSLRNRGKYEISYNFSFKRPSISNNFTVSPMEGKIEPGGAAEISLTFTSSTETTLRNNRDIRCIVSEPHTGEAIEQFTVSVSVASFYSRIRLQPARGLNFGAIKYNEPPRQRRFELKNEGLFEFTFTVTGHEPDEESLGAIISATPEGLRPPDSSPGGSVKTEDRTVGQFTISPAGGVLQPGQSVSVEVMFSPKDSAVFREDLKILISGCDEEDANIINANVYECVGESCFPGIVKDEWRSIFEEQTVIGSLSELKNVSEKGSNKISATSSSSSNGSSVGKAVFAEEDVLFAFGNVISSSTQQEKGTVEKFKITNPTKVNASVGFSLTASSGGLPQDVDVFTVQPTSWEIPPHEYRYVSVYFRPQEMRQYRSTFLATVADAHPSQETSKGVGSKMQFDLNGAGTLPCVNVKSPNVANDAGDLIMPFGSVEHGKSATQKIMLSNNGVVPSTVLFNLEDDSGCIEFKKSNGSETMEPGESRVLDVVFRPSAKCLQGGSEVVSKINMSVMHNNFESETIVITGTTFSNDCVIEDIGDTDELKFDEVDLNAVENTSEIHFSLRSQSDEPLRFEFGTHECFNFMPCVGHLPPGGRRDIVGYFDTKGENTTFLAEEVSFTTNKIEYLAVANDGVDADDESAAANKAASLLKATVTAWDDNMKEVRQATEEELVELSAATSSSTVRFVEEINGIKMVEVMIPEPAYNKKEGIEPQIRQVKCTGIAGVAKYECETKSIVFKPSAMFQTRQHKFTVSNSGETQLAYSWDLANVPLNQRPVDALRPASPPVPCPFTIEPSEGAIAAKSEQNFVVKFSPLEVDDFCYVASCNMPSLETAMSKIREAAANADVDVDADATTNADAPMDADANDIKTLMIGLRGKASRPIVHFELPDQNDYLSRRPANLRNELGLFGQIEASSVRVIEMESRGTRVRNTKRFHVVNPTATAYHFNWVPQGNPSPAWRCTTSSGMILAGKRGEMVFEYTPDDVDVAESFYKFKIENTSVDELFLFSGSVVEPVVTFDRQRLDFGAQLLGGLCNETVHIVNGEHLPFSFNFDLMSMGGSSEVPPGFRRPVLEITPMSGLVPPNSRTPVNINFSPAEEKFHNFNLICDVRKKPNRLNLNVKGEGYAVHSKIMLNEEMKDAGSGERELVSSKHGVNFVDFGAVHLNEKLVKTVSIHNTGKFNSDFSWTRSTNNPMLSIVNTNETTKKGRLSTVGSLKHGDRIVFNLEFAPVAETVLDGGFITVTIAGRYEYILQLAGSGVRPALHFSFTNYDFGASFITAPGAQLEPTETVLTVTNGDMENSLSIDCAFVNQRALSVDCKPTVLEPGMSVEIPFLFAPREVKDYSFAVPFLVNGTSKQIVSLLGRGVYARLELFDLHQSHVNFGAVMEGNSVTKNVKVVNRSLAELTFSLVDETKPGFGKGVLESNDVLVSPSTLTTLGPKQSCVLSLTFAPQRRVPAFQEDLLVRYAGETRKLLAIAGSATGFEVMLETDALPFGVVMAGSLRSRKLNFENSGDLPARLKWVESTFGEHFSISPVDVNVPPGSEFAFDVVFSPEEISDDLRQEGIKLLVDGGEPLSLTCTGSCVPQPDDSVKTLSFSSLARKMEIQTVEISNPTDKVWTLTPVMKGGDWRGLDEISVPGKSKVEYKVEYFPLTMTRDAVNADAENNVEAQDAEKHMGSLFFALPDGSALLFNLEGVAKGPEPEARGEYSCNAKEMLTIPLPVKNWLKRPQKFTVDITLADENDEGASTSTFLSGANQIDVPSNATRDYPLRFFSYKEGVRAAVLKFTNIESGEYLYHEIAVKVGEAGVQESYKIEAPIRQVAKKIITIDNPLGRDKTVTFKEDWWKCENDCVRLSRLGEMSGNKEGTFELEYRPLLLGATEKCQLMFDIEELGTYKYDLELVALPTSANYKLAFECPLGGKQTESFTFRSYNGGGSVEYDCGVEKPKFFTINSKVKTEPCENIWDGQDVKVTVEFEPEGLGEVRDVLKVRHPKFGEYECELIGKCKPQLPQGPFIIESGGSKDVDFRNIFDEALDFSFVVDDPQFTVGAGVLSIPARSSKSVSVKFVRDSAAEMAGAAGKRSTDGRVEAKMSVRCVSKSEEIPPWSYYLHGK